METLVCPRCGAPMVKAISYTGTESEFWYVCSLAPKCNTFYNSWKPQEHQRAVLQDSHRFIGNFGGFGSAKTSTTRQLIYKQLFITQNATVLVGANVSSQYEQTIKRELEADIPRDFVKYYSAQKQYMELYNGSRILYRPLDDVDKLRSMNLSAFFIIEGSEVKQEAFTQLKTRLRNTNAAILDGYYTDEQGTKRPIYKHSRAQGIVESNPDNGWIREELVDVADVIFKHGGVGNVIQRKPAAEHDKFISVHVSATDCNAYLPDGYIEALSAGKPKWWIMRYVCGSFDFSVGLILPNYRDLICQPFDIPRTWKKLVAHDPGLVDASAFVNAAIDEREGVCYIYRDNQYHDLSVAQLHEKWVKEVAGDISPTEFYKPPIMDGKMFGRRMFTDLATLDGMWAQYGVYFQAGHINIKDRLWRLQTYAESGRLKIFSTCEYLLDELPKYKWKTPKNKEGELREEPVDKDNHSIDAMEWILCELPEMPEQLQHNAYDSWGRPLGSTAEEAKQVLWQLQDADDDEYYGAYSNDYV